MVLLNFWATWCAPCVEEIPSLNQLQRQMPQLVVLGVDVDENPAAYQLFLARHEVDFLTIRDAQQQSNALYGTFVFPDTYAIDRRGQIRRKFVNSQDWTSPEICRLPFPSVEPGAWQPACYDDLMTTNLDVLYRYELHPTEAAMIALGKARGVYGIRKIMLDEKQKTMRVEFDFTRLNRDVVTELLRSAGIDIVEEIPLAAPPPPTAEPAQPLPAK